MLIKATIVCGAELHSVRLKNGRYHLLDHSKAQIEAELAAEALGGTLSPCVASLRVWRSPWEHRDALPISLHARCMQCRDLHADRAHAASQDSPLIPIQARWPNIKAREALHRYIQSQNALDSEHTFAIAEHVAWR